LSAALAISGEGSRGWQYGPTLIAALLGLATGAAALQVGSHRGAATWGKTLAGASVLVSLAAAIGTGVIWAFAPHPSSGDLAPNINLPTSCQTITGNSVPPECLPFPDLTPPAGT
jgi:hypothetical protein